MKEFLDELKNIHRRFSRFEFVIVLGFFLLVLLIPNKPEIIGFSDVNIHRQTVNLALDHSQSFSLESDTPAIITSLSISGEVLGRGSASVYLVDSEGNTKKVFDNARRGMSLVTGFYGEKYLPVQSMESAAPILELTESSDVSGFEKQENVFSGEFVASCKDTCVIDTIESSYNLVAYVEPGTTLIIDEIDYTTRQV